MRKAAILVALCLLSATALAKTPSVHIDDLDPTNPPQSLKYHADRDQLFVDGQRVRGSKHDQLDYLAVVLADEAGNPPGALHVGDRHRGLRRQSAGLILLQAGSATGLVVLALTPPGVVLLPVLGGVAVVNGVSLATLQPARRLEEREQLVELLEEFEASDPISDLGD